MNDPFPYQRNPELEQAAIEPLVQHSLEELQAMPHDELASHALEMEKRATSAQNLNASLSRMQLDHMYREEQLLEAADIDPLTGLLNKRAWLERVGLMAEEDAGHFGVIFIDLSKFKHVNDVLGHTKGDEILAKTAETLRLSLRHEDTDQMMHDIGRYGGDEFAVLCDLDPRKESKLSIEERLEVIIERLRERFAAMVEEENLGNLGFDMAIGGAVHENGDTAEDLLKQADKRMYADKYARREKLTTEEIAQINAVRHLLHKAGVRLPDEVINPE